jgi:hypothetical protein
MQRTQFLSHSWHQIIHKFETFGNLGQFMPQLQGYFILLRFADISDQSSRVLVQLSLWLRKILIKKMDQISQELLFLRIFLIFRITLLLRAGQEFLLILFKWNLEGASTPRPLILLNLILTDLKTECIQSFEVK